jgi:hypothetical protein
MARHALIPQQTRALSQCFYCDLQVTDTALKLGVDVGECPTSEEERKAKDEAHAKEFAQWLGARLQNR